MLKLSARNDEPFWLDIVPGVRVQFKPITVAAMVLARRAVSGVFSAVGDDPAAREADDVQATAGVALTRSLAQQGIVAWEGVGDAQGASLEPSPEAIDMLLDIWPAYEAIDRLYVGPAFARDAEKNG